MIKEALEMILGLQRPEIVEVKNRPFSTENLYKIEDVQQKAVEVRTLDAIIKYIKTNPDKVEIKPFIIHIENENAVTLMSEVHGDYLVRHKYLTAKPLLPEQFSFGRYHSHEEFMIGLQSRFERTEPMKELLSIIGTICEENVRSTGDDGVSQSVVAKTGVATVSNVKIPNPVCLTPFRTFIEVEQPASQFILRLKDGPSAALFEADGGAWRNKAIKNIRLYLEDELQEFVDEGSVVIID